jgi:hypothetical protein
MSSAFAILVACVVAVAIAQPLPSSSVAPAQFSCEGLSVGQHAAAVNACESYFYQCSEGYTHGIRLNCTEMTFFDVTSNQCLYARDVVACGGVATTTEATTTWETTTTGQADQGEKFSCANKTDDVYGSDSNKCSSVFWSCSNGDAQMHMCPADLKFDVVSKTCLESDFISACGGQATTTQSQTTKAPINDSIFETACMSHTAGYYSDPREQFKTANGTCSQAFMVCTGSSPVAAVYQCPANLYYDASIIACNYHDETSACTGVPPAMTTPIPTPQVKEAPLGTCDGKIGGNHDVKNETCGREYIACANDGRGWIFTCPSDLYFDVEFNRCDYKEVIPICSGSPRPTVDVETTTTLEATTTTLESTTTTLEATTTTLEATTIAPAVIPVRRR